SRQHLTGGEVVFDDEDVTDGDGCDVIHAWEDIKPGAKSRFRSCLTKELSRATRVERAAVT
ncbi:MAG TPA: hypothetical protein VNZ26_33095, partial [Vicinamibacterales bacterium]|nr:hypothetical protein [Vicinamibacterales bacterium]